MMEYGLPANNSGKLNDQLNDEASKLDLMTLRSS
jgi:hypothetical protein